ncbi:MAG: hypothetical protein ABSF26_17255 [Thermoguttaceae bacterium]|jgi:hypothetical protein
MKLDEYFEQAKGVGVLVPPVPMDSMPRHREGKAGGKQGRLRKGSGLALREVPAKGNRRIR